MEIIKLITPGLIAIVGNIIFYCIVKNKIDKSIEKHKISYAGVFKERIEIYRKLLSMIYDIHYKLSRSVYETSEENFAEIKNNFNDFINFYLINQPFIETSLIEKIKILIKEYQQCFDDNYLGKIKQKNRDTFSEGISQWIEARNKLMTNHFEPIQNEIIEQMRRDLHINNK